LENLIVSGSQSFVTLPEKGWTNAPFLFAETLSQRAFQRPKPRVAEHEFCHMVKKGEK